MTVRNSDTVASIISRSPPSSLSEQQQDQQSFSQTFTERITQDSHALGSAAESLLAVQADINRVQSEVEGKVFDLEDVRRFFAEHAFLKHEVGTCQAKLVEQDRMVKVVGAELREVEMQ